MPKRRTPADDGSKASLVGPAVYAPVFKAGLQATATRVQEMHNAISGKTFDALQRVPGLSVPARLVQGAHDAITTGVYAAVRHGTGALMSLAGDAERFLVNPAHQPQGRELAFLSALNAAAGDALAQAGSPLAVQMGFHTQGETLELTRTALAGLKPRVCVFVHGLACDEQSWSLFPDAWRGSAWEREGASYGSVLASELGIDAIYLRYNTGLAIDDNAHQLCGLLGELTESAPQLREIALVGHSMGGLVARRACERRDEASIAWRRLVRTVVCLGSPHQGAPLEKLGHFVASALSLSNMTQPLGTLANVRSRGIKDLRHGLRGKKREPESPALRLVAGSLADEFDATMGPMVGSMLGDGLVTTTSAADASLAGDVQRVELAGLGHMALLNHPRVYALIRDWLAVPGAAPRG
ncbi:MAG TPA: alpha/beta fold hydrolase [Rhizobacter sp.]|nr:alpha/beta fold hydrolase [Rhizobacter sp.]